MEISGDHMADFLGWLRKFWSFLAKHRKLAIPIAVGLAAILWIAVAHEHISGKLAYADSESEPIKIASMGWWRLSSFLFGRVKVDGASHPGTWWFVGFRVQDRVAVAYASQGSLDYIGVMTMSKDRSAENLNEWRGFWWGDDIDKAGSVYTDRCPMFFIENEDSIRARNSVHGECERVSWLPASSPSTGESPPATTPSTGTRTVLAQDHAQERDGGARH
jgi:hypothetical protein